MHSAQLLVSHSHVFDCVGLLFELAKPNRKLDSDKNSDTYGNPKVRFLALKNPIDSLINLINYSFG